jgi:hypothetical protein
MTRRLQQAGAKLDFVTALNLKRYVRARGGHKVKCRLDIGTRLAG